MINLSLFIFLLSLTLPSFGLLSSTLTPHEKQFLSVPDHTRLRTNLQFYSSIAHPGGTPGDYETVQFTAKQFEKFGFNTTIEAFPTLMSYPVSNSLQLLHPFPFTASLSEDISPLDPTSDTWYRNHTYLVFSPSGDIPSAPLVYANFGTIEDFAYLTNTLKMQLNGTVAIVRYGGIFRGTKIHNAQQVGCIGVIIYSDPQQDGYGMGKTYTDGPWRPQSGVQRGSAEFLDLCPGDPGRLNGHPDICGYAMDEIIPVIPALPISWGDALPLLIAIERTSNVVAPATWQGGLNITYHIGGWNSKDNDHHDGDIDISNPNMAIIRLSSIVSFQNVTFWNVVGTMKGTDPDPDTANSLVMYGNHRDGHVFGCVDPNSGTVALLEIAAAYHNLTLSGWSPKRTIVLLSWDGEEPGLIGSTHHAETYASELQQNAVVYINVDVGVATKGDKYYASGTPIWSDLIIGVTEDIIDPDSEAPLSTQWDNVLGVLGSGSDFTAYNDHLGISVMDMGFYNTYGTYHSIYDSFYWMDHFGDPATKNHPSFMYHVAIAQTWGLFGLRVVDSGILPMNYTKYGIAVTSYVDTVNGLLQQYGWSNDSNIQSTMSQVSNAVLIFTQSCYQFNIYKDTELPPNIPPSTITHINNGMLSVERLFIHPIGLPDRPWYKHVLQSSGWGLGYGADVLPGLTQSVKQGRKGQFQTEGEVLREILYDVSLFLIQLAGEGESERMTVGTKMTEGGKKRSELAKRIHNEKKELQKEKFRREVR